MSEIFAIFVEPFQFAFMQNALLTALVVAVICALLSCYLVLKGWSLMGGCHFSCCPTWHCLSFFSRYSISDWCICFWYCLCLRGGLFKKKTAVSKKILRWGLYFRDDLPLVWCCSLKSKHHNISHTSYSETYWV